MLIRLGGVFILGLALYLWVQGLFVDIYNFPCHVDVTQWVEATKSFARGDYEDAAERDRPMLMLFLSAQWMKQGFPALDALTLNARIAWVLCMTVFCAWAVRMYNVRAAIIAMIFLFWSHSYSGLVLSVAAQLPFNALVAVNLFLGFGLARAKNPFAWMALGFLSFLLPLCKEQGFFFPLMSMLFLLYSSPKGMMKKTYRGLFFFVGASPLMAVLYWWQSLMLTHGNKYDELFSDLNILHSNDSFLGKSQALLKWGTIETTFHAPKGYGELIYNAWIRLTNEIGVHVLLGLGLALLAIVICRLTQRSIKKEALIWTVFHGLPAIPLFILLLIEPYHLSFLEIPAAGLLAWSAFHLLPQESALKREGWPENWLSWQSFGCALLAVAVSISVVRGQPFFWAMPWEIGSCITERLLPVMHAAKRSSRLQNQTIYVTDNAIRYAKALPENWKESPTASNLHQMRCEEEFLIMTSEMSSGYVTMSELFHPRQWERIEEISSINNENWMVYKGICR